MPEVWATTDFSEMPNTRAIAALLRPCAMSARTSRRRVLSRSTASSRRASIAVITSGSSATPPSATRRRSAAEARGVGDPLLEQVADRRRPFTEQLGGVLAVDVVRQHHHRGARLLGADPLGGPQPVVGAGRWHAQVGEHQVWAGPGAGGDDLVGVGDGGDDLDPLALRTSVRPSRSRASSSPITTRTGAPPRAGCRDRAGCRAEPSLRGRSPGRSSPAGRCRSARRRRRHRRRPGRAGSARTVRGRSPAERPTRASRRSSPPRRRRGRRCSRPTQAGRDSTSASISTSTGSGLRAARSRTAAASPRSSSNAGITPWTIRRQLVDRLVDAAAQRVPPVRPRRR